MDNETYQSGRVVLAKAGRDKGKAFIIIRRLDDEYVLIADGGGRTMEQPKKKKTKHLKPAPFLLRELKQKLEEGKPVMDAELRKSLQSLGYEN